MKTILVIVFCGIGVCCAAAAAAGTSPPPIVASFYPLAFAAGEIAGPATRVVDLTPAGTEPHDVELKPSAATTLRGARVVFYLGSGFQPAVEKAIRSTHARSVDLLQGLGLHDGTNEEGDHAADPHVWLDPLRYGRMAAVIGRSLGRPGAAARFAARLDTLDTQYRRGLAHCARRTIVTSHAAFGYLASRYGLTQLALEGLSPEAEPTPRALARLIDKVRRSHATTVFFETLVSPRLADTVAREAHVGTAVLDPIEGLTPAARKRGETYFTVMRSNLATLRSALGCR